MKKAYIQPVSTTIQLVEELMIAASLVDRQDSITDTPIENDGHAGGDSPIWGDNDWKNGVWGN